MDIDASHVKVVNKKLNEHEVNSNPPSSPSMNINKQKEDLFSSNTFSIPQTQKKI